MEPSGASSSVYIPGSGNPALRRQEAEEQAEILGFRRHSSPSSEEGEHARQRKLYELQ